MTLPRDLVGHHRSVIDQAVRPHELHLPFHPPVQHFTFEIDTVGHQTLRLAIECIVCRGHLNVQIRVKIRVKIRLEIYSVLPGLHLVTECCQDFKFPQCDTGFPLSLSRFQDFQDFKCDTGFPLSLAMMSPAREDSTSNPIRVRVRVRVRVVSPARELTRPRIGGLRAAKGD